MVLNAAERSSNIKAVGLLSTRISELHFLIDRRAVSVDRPVLYADWYGFSKLWIDMFLELLSNHSFNQY